MARKPDEARAAARTALGLRLRVLRTGRRMTNKDVALALSIRPATLTAWEAGTSELAALDALRLADLYRVDISVIFGRAAMPSVEASTKDP